ncbi:D-alanyl-D-alanine carboxypeptidase family protein [Vibrio sp. WXL210]|uniref:D-alanyl-D-alanine carboxypeptidase family protein n=1 Tax=Vibrio sp. WXL210 TaxID=3450709 RepID=UPI003EC7EB96
MVTVTLLFCWSGIASAIDVPSPPELSAKGYVLMDYHSEVVIAEQNGDAALAPASLTKLMTAYVVGQEILAQRLDWQDTVTVSVNAWSQKFPESSKMFIAPKDQISVANLMRGVIVQSGNDACVALAEHVAGSEAAFVSLMNEWADNLGMYDTRFINSHGLDAEGIQTTPRDMALLMKNIIEDVPEVYQIYSEKQFTWNDIKQYNRNSLLWDNAVNVDGGKTGYTSNAGYSLVSSAIDGDNRLISVVMGTNSKDARASQSRNLLSYGFRFYTTVKIADRGDVESKVRVWKGDINQIDAGFDKDAYITFPRNKRRTLERTVVLNEPLMAPIGLGQEVGQIIWTDDEEVVVSYPLVSAQAVEEGNWFSKLWDGTVLWFKSLFASFLAS